MATASPGKRVVIVGIQPVDGLKSTKLQHLLPDQGGMIDNIRAGVLNIQEGNPEIRPVTSQDVIKIFKENNEKLKELLFKAIPKVAQSRQCVCSRALEGAVIS